MKTYSLAVREKDPLDAMNRFFRELLRQRVVDILLVPQDTPAKLSVVQTLVKAEDQMEAANPFAPLLLLNSATLASQLTFDKPKERIGVVMRSCEIRATIELAKLRQVDMDSLLVIGVDCPGTYESNDYQRLLQKFKDNRSLTLHFLSEIKGARSGPGGQEQLRPACSCCEYPAPENADIAINFFGCDTDKELFIRLSEKTGKWDIEKFGLIAVEDTSAWQEACRAERDRRTKARDKLFGDVLNAMKDEKGLLKELAHCRRCSNCRRACPICYCRDCIFDTLLFEHDSGQYFQWAAKKGRIRMPADTLLFHLTRMNHMVVSCVACGQCTSACPNGIPVAKFFKTVGAKVQELFGYVPGRNITDEIPQATFKEDEFREIGA